jgi:hypothetical protein
MWMSRMIDMGVLLAGRDDWCCQDNARCAVWFYACLLMTNRPGGNVLAALNGGLWAAYVVFQDLIDLMVGPHVPARRHPCL